MALCARACLCPTCGLTQTRLTPSLILQRALPLRWLVVAEEMERVVAVAEAVKGLAMGGQALQEHQGNHPLWHTKAALNQRLEVQEDREAPADEPILKSLQI